MRLPEGKQKIATGCYYTMSQAKKLAINLSIIIKWYGIPFLMWKMAHKEYNFKWYQYPWLIGLIAKHTFKSWFGKT